MPAKMFPAKLSPAKMRLFSKPTFSTTLAAVAALGLLTPMARAAEPRIALRDSASPQSRLRAAHLLGRLDAAAPLRVGLTLPLRNQSQLDALLRRQYTSGDPLYHQFLTPAQFTARFGPTAEDYAAVAAYARAQGLTVAETSPGRTLLSVTGPSAKIEAAFGVQMSRYRLPNGSVVFSNSAAPVLPRSVAVRLAGVAGLSSPARMRPQFRRLHSDLQSRNLQPHAPVPITGGSGGIGSGPLGGLSPNDVKYAYGLSPITPLYGTAVAAPAGALSGAGQNIGLFELDGYVLGDIVKYVSQFSLPTVLTGTTASVTTLPVGTSKGLPVTIEGKTEVTLDIDMILALAPAATGVYVYEDNQEPTTTGTTVTPGDPIAPLTIFTRMANDLNPNGSNKPLVQVISCSWGINESQEDPAIYNGEYTLFQQMAAQGQSLFCSSGDNGAYDAYTSIINGTTVISSGLTSPEVDNPASQPYATGVGGTTLSYLKPSTNATTGAVTGGTYTGETVWSAGTPSVSPEGSGGGVSTLWAKPAYQTGVGTSPIRREVPDVSLNADPNAGYSIFVGSTNTTGVVTTTTTTDTSVAEVVGGTSAAAPLWAAYTALINEQRTLNGLGPIGFLNPLLYPIAAGSSYAAEFHDIVSGTNLFYQAGTGYDDASGLGSFQGAPLLAALSLNANQGTGTAVLTGLVTDSGTPPVPVAGATVTAVVTSTGAVAGTATTDTTGAYTLTVPTGLTLRITVGTGTITAPAGISYSSTPQTVSVPATGTPPPVNFALTSAQAFAAGLQMISAPYDYTGLGDFAAEFGLTPAQAQRSPRLIQYAPSLSSYVFYPTAPADTLRLGQGYWVRFPSASYLHLTGTPASTASAFSIPLQQGWNQIGDPFLLAAPLSTIAVVSSAGTTVGLLPASPAVVQPTLYLFDPAINNYTALDPSVASLSPFTGYWVFAFQNCSLSVPSPGAPAPPAAPGAPPIP